MGLWLDMGYLMLSLSCLSLLVVVRGGLGDGGEALDGVQV